MSWSCMLLLLLAFLVEVGADQNQCKESKCGHKGPAIRFPFRLKDEPKHCGYPGFELSCSGKHTVLELPISSVKLFVRHIDYKSQVIKAYDPENCLRRQLLKIGNTSTSPFHFKQHKLSNYTLFNCSKEEEPLHYESDPCLGGPTYIIYVIPSYSPIEYYISGDMFSFSNCTKINTSPIPYYGDDNIYLGWLRPTCGHCEAQGKRCRLNNNATKVETECYRPKPSRGKLMKFVDIGVTLGAAALVIFLVIAYRAYSFNKQEKEIQRRIEKSLEDYKAMKPSRYLYVDITHITNQFDNKLGEGAFGTVFKGKLSNDLFVAVKILNNVSKGNGEDFINEVRTIGRIHHVNVVRLVGYCADGFRRALVYEFLPNGSLQQYISSPDSNDFLGWEKLKDITSGIAKGIEYLHQGCDQRILHFDIKPHNVLLDHSFTPKISDFGLAKLCSKDQSIVSMTTARGTMGYIAPEVFSRNFGSVSYKSDVYSFGIMLLEMIGGRKVTDVAEDNTNQVHYPEWIYNLLEEGEDLRIHIGGDGDSKIAKKLAIIGLWCIQWHPADRPSMKVVVHMLEGGEDLSMPPNPFASTGSTKTVANMPRRRVNMELEAIAELE